MAWEPGSHTNTLLVQRLDLGNGRYEYHLHPFFRRNSPESGVFMCPFSESMRENSQLVFRAIEFLDCPRMSSGRKDGDTVLCASDYYQRMSLGSLT